MPAVTLDELDHLSHGKRARLYELLYNHGPGNGTMLILPIDQGMEHGPIDMFPNPPSIDADFQWKLALEGGFSGIALHIGLAEKYMKKYAGKVPLILKINGKTNIPPGDEALSPMTGSVEDAVRLGAVAVGYTLYVGSPMQTADFTQFRKVKADAERYGMPVIMWSYPRGKHIAGKGGQDSIYAVDYAARVADELGADVVKLNAPKVGKDNIKPYDTLNEDADAALGRVIKSAGRTMVLFSGGSKISDEDLLKKAKISMEKGATGLIFGRNLWQRKWDDALAITEKIKAVMRQA